MAETRFYTTTGCNDSGESITILNKAVYDNGLNVYVVAASADEGTLYLNQIKSPFHRDSADGVHPETEEPVVTVVEFNRAWDSAGEAFKWFEGGLV